MKLFMADYDLEAGRLARAASAERGAGNVEEAGESWAERAKGLVEECGYHRRDGEVKNFELGIENEE